MYIFIYIYKYWCISVAVINITVKGTLKCTGACAISDILNFKLSSCSKGFMLSYG